MKILLATSEAVPYVKTGGLADVTSALIKEYNSLKKEAYLILPLYKSVKEAFKLKNTGLKIEVPVGNKNLVGRIYSEGTSAYFIACNEFFDREDLYGTPLGDYHDNAARFIFFSRGVLEACKAINFKPDVIHCHDWQTGLIPLYLKTIYKGDKFFSKVSTVITVHNLGYQGLFPQSEMPLTGLDPVLFNPEEIEFYGKINFLKAGLISADSITTVSNGYAGEILTKEYGLGLDGVLRKRASDLTGIINGIDYSEWNPKTDYFIPKNYSIKDIAGKKECKLQLLKDCSIRSDDKIPMIGMIGRLSSQKGLNLVLDGIDDLLSLGINLVILGKGDEVFHRTLSEAAERYKGRLSVRIGFEENLAHKIYAGSDMFLMPSRYEPCGLGQLIAMRYGTIPVARRTGGLADTIEDYNPLTSKGTGFLFSDYTPSAMVDAVKRALLVYTDRNRMKKMVIGAMKMDFSWRSSAKKYIQLYNITIKKKQIQKQRKVNLSTKGE